MTTTPHALPPSKTRWGTYPGRLTREQVQAKYGPVPDPWWTSERVDAFLAQLPHPAYRHTVPLDDVRAMLVRDFGRTDLKAQRMGAAYVSTLGAILGLFAEADSYGVECLVSQRDAHLGTAMVIRNIVTQMQSDGVGLMVKETRAQGHGFVGSVYVYAPQGRYRHRTASPSYWEQLCRSIEGKNKKPPPLPANLTGEDVPY